MRYFTDNKEGLFLVAMMGSHWLCVWLGVDMERTKQRYIKQTQYKLDNEQRKRNN
jgi:hypothetical protein